MSDEQAKELARRICYRLDIAGFLNVKGNSFMETGEKIKQAIQVVLNAMRERQSHEHSS